jgi:Zn-dependent protease with chaperone function
VTSDAIRARLRNPAASADLETAAILRTWLQNPPNKTETFSDDQLLRYRHPRETRSFWLAILVLVAVLAVVTAVSGAIALLVVGVLWAVSLAVSFVFIARHIAHAAEITPTQFAHLHPMVEELRQRFAMPRTRVFVLQSPIINAYAFGFKEPYLLVLHSTLVDAMDAVELKSVLGHEMAHIKFGHTRRGILVGGLLADAGFRLPFPLSLVENVRDLIFLWWERNQEMTADRAGIVATGQMGKSVTALVKLAVGPTLYQFVSMEDLARQAADLRSGWWRLWGFFSQLQVSHPYLVNRILALIDFVDGPQTPVLKRPPTPPAAPASA